VRSKRLTLPEAKRSKTSRTVACRTLLVRQACCSWLGPADEQLERSDGWRDRRSGRCDRSLGHHVHVMRVRRLRAEDVSLVGAIDRSEHVDVQYRVVHGHLQQVPAEMTEVPAWDPTGSGPHSVAAEIEFCTSVVARGGVLLGAFDAERAAGLAVVHPSFEPGLAWLAFLHVSRPYRRRGAAQALWDAAVDMAVVGGAESIYVSATPTESAVGFYLRQGCCLARPVHGALFAAEPEDIHLTCSLR
jgi:ribosomal protein S18 acetylase RimI-like enzyme